MMNCDDFSNQLSNYLEGELPDERSQLINEHISACPACAKKLANVRILSRYLRNLTKLSSSENFEKGLQERLARKIDYTQHNGIDRMLQIFRSLPVKPVVATFAAAASIAFATVVVNSYMHDNEKENKAVVTPRIEIPALPGSNRKPAIQSYPYTNIPAQRDLISISDSSTQLLNNPLMRNQFPDDVMESMRNRMLQVKVPKR